MGTSDDDYDDVLISLSDTVDFDVGWHVQRSHVDTTSDTRQRLPAETRGRADSRDCRLHVSGELPERQHYYQRGRCRINSVRATRSVISVDTLLRLVDAAHASI